MIRRLRSWIGDRLRNRDYPNFGWVVWWELTRTCNLNCTYCISHRPGNEVDESGVWRGLEEIIRVRPKYVEILGGEPLLVRSLPEVLNRLREEAGVTRIMMSSNLSGPIERAERILGKVDHLFVSIDGLGDVNKRLRGIDGDALLERITHLRRLIERDQHATLLHTATVVTRDNYREIEPLIHAVGAVSSDIEMVLIPVEPYDHPMSLLHSEDARRDLLAQVDRLAEQYPVILTDRFKEGLTATNPCGNADEDPGASTAGTAPERDRGAAQGRRRLKLPSHQCPRQFFRLVINERGETITCKPARYLEYYGQAFREARGLADRARLLTAMAEDLILRPNSMTCRLPCSAAEFLDELLLLRKGMPMPREIEMFAGQFESAELERSLAFIRKFLNPELDERLERALRKPEESVDEREGG